MWFQGAEWISKSLKAGIEYLVFGKPVLFNGQYNISHPEMELFTDELKAEGKGLQPVYSSSEKAKKKGLDSRGIARLSLTLTGQLQERDVPEFFPPEILQKQHLLARYGALTNIHFPKNETLLAEATKRLKFEELFLIQLQMMKIRAKRHEVHGVAFLKKLITSSINSIRRI